MNVIVSNKYKILLNTLNYDISKSINGVFTVNQIIHSFSNFFFNRMFLDLTAIKGHKDMKNMKKLASSLDMSKVILLLDDNYNTITDEYISSLIDLGIYNFTRNREGIIKLYEKANTYEDVAKYHINNNTINIKNVGTKENTTGIKDNNKNNIKIEPKIKEKNKKIRVLGIKSLTTQAGATTLIYMLKNELSKYYNVVALEVNKRDFLYFRDTNLKITTRDLIKDSIEKNKDADIILLDLNNNNYDCDEILYLIEPTTIKLNKMVMLDRNALEKIGNKKIVLNKSLLNNKEVQDFEKESNIKVFYNLPPMNDKKDNSTILLPFLSKVGLLKKNDVLVNLVTTDNDDDSAKDNKIIKTSYKDKILDLFKF